MHPNDQTPEAKTVIASLAARLASSSAAEWRIDDDEAILILDALLDQINLGGDAPQVRCLNAQYASLLRRMGRFNQLNSWTAVFISALFAAVFMVDNMLPHAIVAGIWAVIAALWARSVNNVKDSTGGGHNHHEKEFPADE